MNICIIKNGVIDNIIVIPDGASPSDFGGHIISGIPAIGDAVDSDLTCPAALQRQAEEGQILNDE